MNPCVNCFGNTRKNEAIESVKKEAKQVAVQTGEPQIIYKLGEQYAYIPASQSIPTGGKSVTLVSEYY